MKVSELFEQEQPFTGTYNLFYSAYDHDKGTFRSNDDLMNAIYDFCQRTKSSKLVDGSEEGDIRLEPQLGNLDVTGKGWYGLFNFYDIKVANVPMGTVREDTFHDKTDTHINKSLLQLAKDNHFEGNATRAIVDAVVAGAKRCGKLTPKLEQTAQVILKSAKD